LDSVARQLYVADAGNHAVRLVDFATGRLVTVAGVLGSSGRSGLVGDPATVVQLFLSHRSCCGS